MFSKDRRPFEPKIDFWSHYKDWRGLRTLEGGGPAQGSAGMIGAGDVDERVEGLGIMFF